MVKQKLQEKRKERRLDMETGSSRWKNLACYYVVFNLLFLWNNKKKQNQKERKNWFEVKLKQVEQRDTN